MQIRQLTLELFISPQIRAGDIDVLAAQGYRTIINNRPDKDDEGQPSSAELESAARRNGMDYRHIPIVPGQLTDRAIEAFVAAMREAKGPVLAFCRTGTRSASLWALSEAPRLHSDVILKTAAAAGYDLTALRPRLEALQRSAAADAGPGAA